MAAFDDQDILELLAARQYEAAFGPLLERFRERVFRLAFSILRNETQAADVTQDVFVKIWKGLPAYHRGASLSTWIYAITRNTCLTELTRRERRPTVSLSEPELAAAADSLPALQFNDPSPGAEMDVEVLLAQLPENYRRVITLFYLEEKAYEEVARMLGIPLGTVKTLLFRAKKELLRIHARQTRAGQGGAIENVLPLQPAIRIKPGDEVGGKIKYQKEPEGVLARPHPDPLPRGEGTAIGQFGFQQSLRANAAAFFSNELRAFLLLHGGRPG